jgi:hypothetical protein
LSRRETVAGDKKVLEDKLAEEKCKTQEANSQFNTTNIGKTNFPTIFLIHCLVLLRAGP